MVFCASLVSHVRPKMHSLATWQNVMIQKCEIPNGPSLHLDAWLIFCTVLKSHDLAKMQRPQDDVIFCPFQLYHSFNFAYFLPPANEVCEGCVFISVCLSTGRGCLPHCKCMLGYTPFSWTRGRQPPPPGADTSPGPEADTPQEETPPGPEADPPEQTRATSGRYASYWNAYLLKIWKHDKLVFKKLAGKASRHFWRIRNTHHARGIFRTLRNVLKSAFLHDHEAQLSSL